MLATGLANDLTHMVFCQPFVIQHVKRRPLRNLKVLIFLYSHQHENSFCSLMLFFLFLLHSCYFVIRVTNCMNKLLPLLGLPIGYPAEMITTRFAAWICDRIVRFQQDTYIQKLLFRRNRIRIRIFGPRSFGPNFVDSSC